MMIYLIFSQLIRHPFIKLFHLSNLFQMLTDCRMVKTEFFDNLLYNCKRISLNWSLSTSHSQPLCSSSSRLSPPLQNFLNHHLTVLLLAVPEPNVLLMLGVISAALCPILSSNKKSLKFAFCLTSFP